MAIKDDAIKAVGWGGAALSIGLGVALGSAVAAAAVVLFGKK